MTDSLTQARINAVRRHLQAVREYGGMRKGNMLPGPKPSRIKGADRSLRLINMLVRIGATPVEKKI